MKGVKHSLLGFVFGENNAQYVANWWGFLRSGFWFLKHCGSFGFVQLKFLGAFSPLSGLCGGNWAKLGFFFVLWGLFF